MGYTLGKSQNLISHSEYLGGEVNNETHYAKDKFVLTDRDGNKVYYELQSTKHGDPETFQGYLIAEVNKNPEDSAGILKSAKKFFEEHPEIEIKGYKTDATLVSQYCGLLVREAAADAMRNNGRKATTMEKLYLFQNSYLEEINRGSSKPTYLSWEQVLGQQDLGDDHVESSREALLQDEISAAFKEKAVFGDKWNESADKGEKSLRERMKEDALRANKLDITRERDGQVMRSSSPQSSIPETFDEDEKNALVRYAIQRERK